MKKYILFLTVLLMGFSSPALAAKWLSLPATDIYTPAPANDFCGPTSLHYKGGVGGIMAYSGGMWDDAGRSMYIIGGGHGDYWGNEVYKIDVSLTSGVTTTRIYGPDCGTYYYGQPAPCCIGPAGSLSGQTPNQCTGTTENPDVITVPGTSAPTSRHTYQNIAFIPASSSGLSGDKIWLRGGVNPCGGTSSDPTDEWLFDIPTKTWTRLGNTSTGTKTSAPILFAVYHSGNNKIYLTGAEISAYIAYFHEYDVATSVWTRRTFSPMLSGSNGGGNISHKTAILVGDDYYFIGGGGTGVHKVNVNGTPDYQWHAVTTTGETAITAANSPGVAYDSKRNTIVGWIGNETDAAAQSIYSLNLSTLVWTKTTVTLDAPTSGQTNGIFGRFAYSSKMDSYVMVNNTSGTTHLFCPDNYPTDLWFSRTLPAASGCTSGNCKHIRMGQVPGENLIYFFGGDNGGSSVSTIYTYDVTTGDSTGTGWTRVLDQCVAEGTVQLVGLDQGALFYADNGYFYYSYAGNYCNQMCRATDGCPAGVVYDPACPYPTSGKCYNSAQQALVNLKFNPSTNTWNPTPWQAHPTFPFTVWGLVYDSTSNKAIRFSSDTTGPVYRRLYDVATNTWSTSKTFSEIPNADGPGIAEGFWAHDKINRVTYIWNYWCGNPSALPTPTGDGRPGYIYKYDWNTDTVSIVSSIAPNDVPQGMSYWAPQYQSQWDSANQIILMNMSIDNQLFPMKFHTYKPSTNEWQINLLYNSWNAKSPWGRETFYDATHNLYMVMGSDGDTHGTNQMWLYRYGGGAGSGDVTPPVMSAALPSGWQKCTSQPMNTTLQVTTDEVATCKYSTTDTTYDLMSNTFSSTGGLPIPKRSQSDVEPLILTTPDVWMLLEIRIQVPPQQHSQLIKKPSFISRGLMMKGLTMIRKNIAKIPKRDKPKKEKKKG